MYPLHVNNRTLKERGGTEREKIDGGREIGEGGGRGRKREREGISCTHEKISSALSIEVLRIVKSTYCILLLLLLFTITITITTIIVIIISVITNTVRFYLKNVQSTGIN